jgi:molecular chaperone GrpE
MTESHEDQPFVVNDKRKIDPKTGEARPEAAADAAASAEATEEAAAFTDIAIAELTSDLQRLQAEYSNYRKRVERDRSLARDNAVGDVLGALLPVLDDLQRAREHNEFSGAFKAVGEAIEAVAHKFGLETFGSVGEEFDPAVHEALTHTAADDAGVSPITVVAQVYQVGYRHAGRVLRAARVGVQDRSAE